MSKPISTALELDGLFRADNVAPVHGDKASQGPITVKSDSAGASAARPSRPANVNTPTVSYLDSITVEVGGSSFGYSLGNNVARGGTVVLESLDGGPFNVRTEIAGTATDVFGTGSSTYVADGTTQYQLLQSITGTVTLVNLNPTVTASSAIARQTHEHDRGRGHGRGHGHGGGGLGGGDSGYGDAGGKNGNINVGG